MISTLLATCSLALSITAVNQVTLINPYGVSNNNVIVGSVDSLPNDYMEFERSTESNLYKINNIAINGYYFYRIGGLEYFKYWGIDNDIRYISNNLIGSFSGLDSNEYFVPYILNEQNNEFLIFDTNQLTYHYIGDGLINYSFNIRLSYLYELLNGNNEDFYFGWSLVTTLTNLTELGGLSGHGSISLFEYLYTFQGLDTLVFNSSSVNYNSGYNNGYASGYQDGYEYGVDFSGQEISILDFITSILNAPINMIKNLFVQSNFVEIFGFSIGTTLISIACVFIFIRVIKLLKG